MRGSKGQYGSVKELYAKAEEARAQQAKQSELLKAMEPLLKAELFDRMVNRKPITIIRPFTYLTEEMEKSSGGLGKFRETTKQLPAGTILTFQNINKTLKQWIFKSDLGDEIEVYDAPIVHFGHGVIQNPAWYGLLLNTDIYESVRAQVEERDLAGE